MSRFYIPAATWFIICTVLLTLPGSALPGESVFDQIPFFDKWVHIGLLSVLCFLLCYAGAKTTYDKPTRRKLFIRWGIGAALYGTVMEVIQHYFIPNRSFDLMDIAADLAGAVAGIIAGWWVYIKK